MKIELIENHILQFENELFKQEVRKSSQNQFSHNNSINLKYMLIFCII